MVMLETHLEMPALETWLETLTLESWPAELMSDMVTSATYETVPEHWLHVQRRHPTHTTPSAQRGLKQCRSGEVG